MAPQKMHCALQGTHHDHQKVSDLGEFYSHRKLLQTDDPKSSSVDFQISSLNFSYTGQRHGVLTLFTRESDGSWKLVALPFQYFDHANHFRSQEQVNMDGLHFVSPPFKVDGWQTKKGPPPGFTYSGGPFTARSFPGNNVPNQFRHRSVSTKVNKLNEFSSNSSRQSYVACRSPSAFLPKRSKTSNSTDVLFDSPKEDRAAKRNSKNKARKKGKQNRKYSSDTVSTRPEICSEYVRGGSTHEAYNHSDINSGFGLASCATSSEVSSTLDSEGWNHVMINKSESADIFTSDVDDEDISEDTGPSLFPHLHKEPNANDSNIQIEIDQRLPIFSGGLVEERTLEKCCHDDLHGGEFSDKNDNLVLDLISAGSNSDDNTSPLCSVRPIDNNSQETRLSEQLVSNAKRVFSSQRNMQSCAADANDSMERAKCGGQAFVNNDIQVAAAGKRNKQFRTVPRCSSICRLGGIGNLQGRSGKENNHSVWQKVQKNGVDECNDVLKKMSPAISHFDATFREAPFFKVNNTVADVTMKSRFDDKKQLKDKALQKLKQKGSSPSEQGKSCYSRNASPISKVNLSAQVKTCMLKDGMLDISTHLDSQRGMNRISMPFLFANGQSSEMQTIKGEGMKPVEISQVHPGNLGSLEIANGTISVINDLYTENINSSQRKPPVSVDQNSQPERPERQSVVYLPHHLVNYASQMGKEVSPGEKSKEKQSSGSTLQKWIPIGVKDTGLMGTVTSGSSLEYSSVQDPKYRHLGNNTDEKIAANSQNVVSLLNTVVMCRGRASENVDSSHGEKNHFQKLSDLNNVSVNENPEKHTQDILISGSKESSICAHGTDFSKLATVLDDACRAQMASEAVQMATGNPIAEFERLLHFSCPVICHSDSSLKCQSCLCNQVSRALLCKHETPNVQLGSLWEWYEKHGSYGLEIRAEDYENPKSLGFNRYAFRAYFVPYLSAVQLFRNSKGSSVMNSSGIHTSRFPKHSVNVPAFGQSSNVGCLPIFSVLVPQPRISDKGIVPLVKELDTSEKIVLQKDMVSDSSTDMTLSPDLDLLFEYFESEQPQKRRSLYEKIQELVRGDVPPRCNIYGDPATLNSINLADLHPKSWYAVAWYPIYRIPDGNLRAAFLTYHSLGHLVRRSTKVDHSSVDACIVSPVVGLQSYNAQGECWFQLRRSTLSPTAESHGLNPSGILKERLRTLEEMASLMARAVVNKGNQTSVNRHPDYEHFLSRRG